MKHGVDIHETQAKRMESHQDVVELVQLGFADLLLHLLVCQITLDKEAGLVQALSHLLCILMGGLRDGDDHDLQHHHTYKQAWS